MVDAVVMNEDRQLGPIACLAQEVEFRWHFGTRLAIPPDRVDTLQDGSFSGSCSDSVGSSSVTPGVAHTISGSLLCDVSVEVFFSLEGRPSSGEDALHEF